MRSSGCGIAAAGLALTLLASGPALAAPEVSYDDLGKTIVSPLEACFQVGTRNDCRQIAGGRLPIAPEGFRVYGLRGRLGR